MRRLLFVLAAVLLLPAPVLAQKDEPRIPIGTRLPRWEQPPNEVELNGTKVLYEFAKCIVKAKPAEAKALLASAPDSAGQRTAAGKLLGKWTSCLRRADEMRLTPFLLRGAIAEELFKQQIPSTPALQPLPMKEDYNDLVARLTAASETPVDDEQRSTMAGRWVAYCAAHENPAGLDRLLRTLPGDEAEIAVLRELRPTVSKCLFQNQRAEFTRLTMRTLFAEALYNFYFQRAGGA